MTQGKSKKSMASGQSGGAIGLSGAGASGAADVARSTTVTTAALLDLVADLSSRFANVAAEQADDEITRALQRILRLFDLDRSVIFRVNGASGIVSAVRAVDLRSSSDFPAALNAREQFPWLFHRLISLKAPVALDSLADLPDVAKIDKESFRRWGTRSILTIPITTAQGNDYFVTFASTRHTCRWRSSEIRRLRLLGESLVALIRRKAHEELRREAERFEHLVSHLSSRFAGVLWQDIDGQIDVALKELLAFTGTDQCGFFTILPDQKRACLSHLATYAVKVPAGTTTDYSTTIPWLHRAVVIGMQAIWFTRCDDLPPEAATDKDYLRGKTQAAVYIPYPIDGVTRYVLAVVSNDEAREWSERFIDRLTVLGTVFVSALNRKATVSAQMRAQQRLGAAQKFAHATLDALHEYVGIVDATGTLVESSERWGNLVDPTGPSAPVAVGSNFLLACESSVGAQRDSAMNLAHGIRAVLSGEASSFAMESAHPSVSGLKWVHSRVHRFTVDSDVYAAISHEDITTARKSEQELQELRAQHWHAERVTQTGVLIASLAHELSQPLTAILSNAQAGMRFIARNALDPQEIREILSDIIADEKRAAEIIDSLRLMLRRQPTERALVDVASVVQQVVNMLHTEFVRQQVHVHHECAPDCAVMANRAQLQQVVLNLVVNGVEAMLSLPAGERRLLITVEPTTDGMVRMKVRDSGVGITADELSNVFDAFFTTKSRGTGMGLTICHSIVESHGGRIWGARNDTAGSTFFVELPAARQPLRDVLTGFTARPRVAESVLTGDAR